MNGKWFYGSQGLDYTAELRSEVFVGEQKYPAEKEFDEYEETAWHYCIFDGCEVVGTGRLIKLDEKTFKLGRIAVKKTMRGQHLGEKIVNALVEKGKSLGAEVLRISAQTYAVPFYEKLGFAVCSAEFMDENLPHIDMIYN